MFVGVSLDGYIARPDGAIDWLTDPPPRRHSEVRSSRPAETWDTFYPSVDHIVMGRGTYEKVCTFDSWPYSDKQVLVMSTTLPPHGDQRVTVARTVDEVCQTLNENGAAQVYVDGGRVIQTFLAHGLIDELTVSHAPVLIGAGLPLFGEIEHDVHLTLVASHASDGGMVHATYRVEQPFNDCPA